MFSRSYKNKYLINNKTESELKELLGRLRYVYKNTYSPIKKKKIENEFKYVTEALNKKRRKNNNLPWSFSNDYRYYNNNNYRKYDNNSWSMSTDKHFNSSVCNNYSIIPSPSDSNYAKYLSDANSCINALQKYKNDINFVNNDITQKKKELINLEIPKLSTMYQKLKVDENNKVEQLAKIKIQVNNVKFKYDSIDKSASNYKHQINDNSLDRRYSKIIDYIKESEMSSNHATSKTLESRYNEINNKLKILLEKRKKANLLYKEYANQIELIQNEMNEKQNEKNVIETSLKNFQVLLNSFIKLLSKEITPFQKNIPKINQTLASQDKIQDQTLVQHENSKDQTPMQRENEDQTRSSHRENEIAKDDLKTKELSSILRVLNANLANASSFSSTTAATESPVIKMNNESPFKKDNNRVNQFEVPSFLKPSNSIFESTIPEETATTTKGPTINFVTESERKSEPIPFVFNNNVQEKKSLFAGSPIREDFLFDDDF